MPIVADRAVVMPCLHDETYAHLDVMRHVLSLPASVWFLSGPEHDLAHSLGPVTPHHSVIGSGMDVPKQYDPDEFREEYGIDEPFILYLGRREADKGWPWLVDVFASTKTRVKLVSAGAGHPDVPPRLRGRVIDIGYLTTEQRNSALAAALAYVQPSLMESYSADLDGVLAGGPAGAGPPRGAPSSNGTVRAREADWPSPTRCELGEAPGTVPVHPGGRRTRWAGGAAPT